MFVSSKVESGLHFSNSASDIIFLFVRYIPAIPHILFAITSKTLPDFITVVNNSTRERFTHGLYEPEYVRTELQWSHDLFLPTR